MLCALSCQAVSSDIGCWLDVNDVLIGEQVQLAQ